MMFINSNFSYSEKKQWTTNLFVPGYATLMFCLALQGRET
jgi:hypothetical protein